MRYGYIVTLDITPGSKVILAAFLELRAHSTYFFGVQCPSQIFCLLCRDSSCEPGTCPVAVWECHQAPAQPLLQRWQGLLWLWDLLGGAATGGPLRAVLTLGAPRGYTATWSCPEEKETESHADMLLPPRDGWGAKCHIGRNFIPPKCAINSLCKKELHKCHNNKLRQ